MTDEGGNVLHGCVEDEKGQHEWVDPASRETLLALFGTNRNTWMIGFGFASHHIAAAVVDGRITEQDIAAYSDYEYGKEGGGYPQEASVDIIHKAGLPTWDEPELVNEFGLLTNLSDEDAGISVYAIKAIPKGDAGVHDGTWYFEPEDLEEFGTSIHAVRAGMRTIRTYKEAAQFILDADKYFSDKLAR